MDGTLSPCFSSVPYTSTGPVVRIAVRCDESVSSHRHHLVLVHVPWLKITSSYWVFVYFNVI